MIPNVLSIAGSDPSGGAGIQADIKAISANGGYAMAALSALTAQNTAGVRGVHMVPPGFVADQVAAIFDDIRVDAVKIGMLGTPEIVQAVADALDGQAMPIVLDPVMVAKGGDRLLSEAAVTALRDRLLPRATVITPNLAEAGDLLGRAAAVSRREMEDQAGALLGLGCGAVLMKGGHLDDEESPDLLQSPDGAHWLDAPRLPGGPIHGTGCTLSAALATWLARTGDLRDAAGEAKRYTAAAIAGAGALAVGRGNPPADHFHAARDGAPRDQIARPA